MILQSAIHRKHIPQFRSFRLQAIKAHGTRHPPTPISKLCSVEIYHKHAKHEIFLHYIMLEGENYRVILEKEKIDYITQQ